MEASSDPLYQIRLQKLEQLKAEGKNPFEAIGKQTHTAQEAQELFSKSSNTTKVISVAGRIVIFRDMGKACFIKLLDRSGKLQVYVAQDSLGKEDYKAFKKNDIGDIISATGTLFQTKTGEITLRAQSITLVSKSLQPLPEKWHGLTDNEQIYRQRYLDLIVNDHSRHCFLLRSKIIWSIRQFFWNLGFLEVETPILQNVAGGAAARPFTTHMNALNQSFYLRISLELYLKRLLIAGFDRVFEMGRVFRNEGLSRRHNPEFTMLEAYQAYTDFRGIMQLIYDLIQFICEEAIGSNQIQQSSEDTIILDGKWEEVDYSKLIQEKTGDAHWFSRSKEEKISVCQKLGLSVESSWKDFELSNEIFEKLIGPYLLQPTFVTHIPQELCPLAKLNRQNPEVLDVFELYINGQEIVPAYSEQNDPLIQRELFEKQVGNDKHALDQDFLLAMEYGMPPAGGLGIGIDRLVMTLTGVANIRDTILFPTLKPSSPTL